MNLSDSAKLIKVFCNNALSDKLSKIEKSCVSKSSCNLRAIFSKFGVNKTILKASIELQDITSQIYIINHAVGILLSLPYILEQNEKILSLSLGAGNTGKQFDLETNLKIAEFKFIRWQNKSNTIRQNSTFKDFFYLAESTKRKHKYLYLTELDRPLKFLMGKRKLESVMSKNNQLLKEFRNKYNDKFIEISEYYKYKKNSVSIVDISTIVPDLSSVF